MKFNLTNRIVAVPILVLSIIGCTETPPPPPPPAPEPAPVEIPVEPAPPPGPATVSIGEQEWLQANVATPIDDSYFFDDDSTHLKTYGRLYNWHAARSICPEGFHLPSKEEMETLIEHYGRNSEALDALMLSGPSNFSAKLAGSRTVKGNYRNLRERATFWTSTPAPKKTQAWYLSLDSPISELKFKVGGKGAGFSCRCLKD